MVRRPLHVDEASLSQDLIMFSDLHLRPRERFGGPDFWVKLGLSTIDLANELALESSLPVIFLGDFFHYKDRHPAWLLNVARDRVRVGTERGIEWYFLIGNHDIGSRNASVIDVFGDMRGVTVISSPTVLKIGPPRCAFIPYISSTEETADWAEKLCKEADMLFLHHGLEGAVTGLGYVFPEGVEGKALEEYEWVFCGHYHKFQRVFANAYYLGSPYQLDFGEREDKEKGVWLLDSEKGLVRFEVPGSPRFLQFEGDVSFDVASIEEDLKKAVVKIILKVTRGERASLDIPAMRRELADRGAISTVVETQLEEQAKDRLKVGGKFSWEDVLEKYGEQQRMGKRTLGVGRDILKTVRKEAQ